MLYSSNLLSLKKLHDVAIRNDNMVNILAIYINILQLERVHMLPTVFTRDRGPIFAKRTFCNGSPIFRRMLCRVFHHRRGNTLNSGPICETESGFSSNSNWSIINVN
jgi:hypothetical protein